MTPQLSDKVRQHVLLPLHERVLKGRKIGQYRRFLDQSQWWPREKLLTHQWRELSTLLEHAYTQVPYWSDTFRRVGVTPRDIRTMEDLRALPITEKRQVREQPQQLIARDYVGKTWVKATGGSTGEPMKLHYTPDSYDWRVAISRRGYSWAGYEEGMRQVAIWGAMSFGQRPFYADLKEQIFHGIAGRIMINALRFDDETMARCLQTINSSRPIMVLGYANPLYRFAQYVNAHGGLAVRPRTVVSAAEKIFEHQRVEIEKAFGCPMFETYGCREFMLIGSECEHKTGLHLSVENLVVEVVKEDGTPAAPGETGDLVITDLHNFGMPFIRYRVGDMAVASDTTCPCGRGLPLIREVVGRTLDVIKTRDGQNVCGEAFVHVLKEVQSVKQFQVVQKEIDSLIVRVVPDLNFGDADVQFIHRHIGRLFGDSIKVVVEPVETIALTRSGKLRVTISELASN